MRDYLAFHDTRRRRFTESGLAMASWNENLLCFGIRNAWGGEAIFGSLPEDARHHTYIIGKTGSGKTTLLRNLILQHIARGHGVALIDPHGDLAEDLLNHLPPHRADDLVYFDPGDREHPIGLNLLANVPRDARPLVASGIVDAFKNLWPDSWGPRMEYILHNAVLALLECQNTTLLGVNRLLTDPEYRRWVLRQVRDPFLTEFWQGEYESYDARFMREAIAPIQNKIGQFLLSPVLRNILGQVRNKMSIPFAMDSGRIFIANLAKGRLGHDKANLLGSLLVTQFQLAAMARTNQPEEERRDFYLFVDEFQNFATEAFTSILAEARKYRLCLTLSHQYTGQLSETVRQAVFGNVGTLVSFQVGQSDARMLCAEFGEEFPAPCFVELDRFEALVRLHEGGKTRQPFLAHTLPPINLGRGRKDKLIARSRERFAVQRATIEGRLDRWIAGGAKGFAA